MSGSALEIEIDRNQLLALFRSGNLSSLSVPIMNYNGLNGRFSDISITDIGGTLDGCETVSATPQYSGDGKGSLVVVFGLDRSKCSSSLNDNSGAAQVGTIVAAVVVPVVAVGAAAGFFFWRRRQFALASKNLARKMASMAEPTKPTPTAPAASTEPATATGMKRNASWSHGSKGAKIRNTMDAE